MAKKEYDIGCRLSPHKNILQFYDLFEDEKRNSIFIVMEMCDGDLSKLIKAKRKTKKSFTDPEAFCILAQIFSGISQLTKNNVIHRDLNPENIMFKDGEFKI